MDTLIYFHLAVAAALIVFYYSRKDDSSDVFNSSRDTLNTFKQRMTGEISAEISTLAMPTPDLLVTDGTTQAINYFEGNTNPLKGEKFKNWIDSYISKEFNSLKFYCEYQVIYRRWFKCNKYLNKFVLFFSIFELILTGVCFYWNSICYQKDETNILNFKNYALCVHNTTNWIFCSAALSGFILILGVVLMVYLDYLKNSLAEKRDENYGI